MKKNDYLLLTATGAYSILFYQQNAGINFLLFNIALISVLLLKNIDLVYNKKWLWAAGMCIVSSTAIFVNSSALSIIANVFGLLLLSAFSFNPITSSLFSLGFSIWSVATTIIFVLIDAIKRQTKDGEEEKNQQRKHKGLATSIVIVLGILFFKMYQSANPLFEENTKWINFDFISFTWIFFTLGGFILTYAFLNHRTISFVESWENNLSEKNATALVNDTDSDYFETEKYAGFLLFIILNIMLIVLNVGDMQTLYFHGGLPKNISHSDFVHNGVGIMILSIIVATGLMMYLFRKEFSKSKNNKGLMIGAYIWILQTIIMVSSTAVRNQIYIRDFNLTYRRIGVYIWLCLAIIGLCILFYKIYNKQSNWFLIKTNVATWFTILMLASCINWDKLITNYNTENKPLAEIDFYYLLSLSDANIPELIAVTKKPDFRKIDSHLENYTADINNPNYSKTFSELIEIKIKHFTSGYTRDWRSFDLRDKAILKAIYNQ